LELWPYNRIRTRQGCGEQPDIRPPLDDIAFRQIMSFCAGCLLEFRPRQLVLLLKIIHKSIIDRLPVAYQCQNLDRARPCEIEV